MVPSLAVTEVCHLLAGPQRRGHPGLAAEFCAAIAADELRVIEVTPHDYGRTRAYVDRRTGEGLSRKRSSAAPSVTSPARSARTCAPPRADTHPRGRRPGPLISCRTR
jgi:hypothetical protein